MSRMYLLASWSILIFFETDRPFFAVTHRSEQVADICDSCGDYINFSVIGAVYA